MEGKVSVILGASLALSTELSGAMGGCAGKRSQDPSFSYSLHQELENTVSKRCRSLCHTLQARTLDPVHTVLPSPVSIFIGFIEAIEIASVIAMSSPLALYSRASLCRLVLWVETSCLGSEESGLHVSNGNELSVPFGLNRVQLLNFPASGWDEASAFSACSERV